MIAKMLRFSLFLSLCFLFCQPSLSPLSVFCAQSRASYTATNAAAVKHKRRAFDEVSPGDAETNTTGDLHEF